MPDKTYAKFILNNETYLDLTGDTVDSSSLLAGYTAHDRSGALITGSFDTSIFVLKAGDTMSGSLTIANIEEEQLFEINSKNGLRLALDLSSLCNQGIWSSGYANSLTADGAYIADSSWIIVRDSSNRVKVPKWASRGSSSSPVYFDEDGQPQASSHSFSNYLLKTGGTMAGDLTISKTTSSIGNIAECRVILGNSRDQTTQSGSSLGVLRLYGNKTGYVELRAKSGSTTNNTISFPDSNGTVALTSNLSSYVAKSGSTMTGDLTLSGAPTENLHAATKKYVDDSVANYLPLTGGTLTGNLTIDRLGGDGSASVGAELTLGNNIEWDQENSSFGYINLYSTGTYKCSLRTANNITSNKVLYLPNKDGTLAVTSDLDSYVLKAGDSLTGALSFYDGSTLKSKISNTELQINEHDLLRITPHFAQMFATQITANKNLQTNEFLKVGQYYCDSGNTVESLTNCPVTTAFTMNVEAPIQTIYDDESLTTASYRLRTIKTYIGEVFIQYVTRSNGGVYIYYPWQPVSIGVSKDTYSNTNMKEGNLIARRNGNVVSIVSTGNAVSVASGNWRTYVTIGAVYRPTEEIYANVTNAYGEVKTVRIRTNGNVDLYTGTAISAASNFAFNITYIVD